MYQIGKIPEIVSVKDQLKQLQKSGLIKFWELPYENLLTRLSAAIFFLSPTDDQQLEEIWQSLRQFPDFSCKENTEKQLSNLEWQVVFRPES